MMMSRMCLSAVMFTASVLWGQPVAPVLTPDLPESAVQPLAPGTGLQLLQPTRYLLNAGDQIRIRAAEMEELSDQTLRLDDNGFLNLPVIGRLKAAGLTVSDLESAILNALREYVRDPKVSVELVRGRVDPVFFTGAFRAPGAYPLQGEPTLTEMLNLVGGLAPNAARQIRVTRRTANGALPLPNAVTDELRMISTAVISMAPVSKGLHPAETLVLVPYDTISAERAQMIYMTGSVNRIGAFELGERGYLTITQALALAGGVSRDGDQRRIRILRPVLDTNRRATIEVDLKKVYSGQANDLPVMPNDYVFVPRSNKRMLTTAAVTAIAPLPFVLWSLLR